MFRYLNNPFDFVLRSPPEGEGGGDDEVMERPAKKKSAVVPENFSPQYVRELRMENKGYRLKLNEEREKSKAAEAAKTAAEKAATEAQAAADAKAEQRVMRAELKAEAVKLGMIDLDGLTFLDYSSVKFDDKGELTGGAEALTKLKEAKPHLFGQVTATSNGQKPPTKKTNDPVDVRTLSNEDYAKRKAELGIR